MQILYHSTLSSPKNRSLIARHTVYTVYYTLQTASKVNNFWKTGVEEEVIIILSSKEIPIINISLSVIRWRSTFQIFGNGNKGYWRLTGRGRSYGKQKYVIGKRWGWLVGKKQKLTEKVISNSSEEKVFSSEMINILKNIKNFKVKKSPCNDLEGLKTMKLIQNLYDF